MVLNMLQTFFEQEIDQDGAVINNRHYFKGTNIELQGLIILGIYNIKESERRL